MKSLLRTRLAFLLACGLVAPLAANPVAAPALDKPVELDAAGQNKMVGLKVSRLTMVDYFDRISASPGGHLCVLRTEWSNTTNAAAAIPGLPTRLYLVLNGRRLCELHPRTAEGPFKQIKLEKNGPPVAGPLAFECPAEPVQSLELRYFDSGNGDIAIPLVQGGEEDKPAAGPVSNIVLELAAFGHRQSTTWAGRMAPDDMTFIVVDVRGRSLAKGNGGVPAFADLPEFGRYLCLVVDGAYGYVPEPPAPLKRRFLPLAMTGCEVAFLAPARFTSLELRLDMPSLEKAVAGKPASSAAIVVPLAGERPAPVEDKPIATASDEMFEVAFLGMRLRPEVAWQPPAAKGRLLEIRFRVRNSSAAGQWFQPRAQIRLCDNKNKRFASSELSGQCLHPCGQTLWVPGEQQRTAELIFEIPDEVTEATVEFTSRKEKKTIPLGAIPPLTGESPAAAVLEAPPAVPPPAKATAEQLAAVRIDDTQVFFPDLKPKGLEGVGLTQAEIDKAIVRGRDYLWQQIGGKTDGHKGSKPEILAQLTSKSSHESILISYALLHSGAAGAYPEFAPYLRTALFKASKAGTLNAYQVALLAMLADSWRGPGSDRWLWLAGRDFVEAQGTEGSWSYSAGDVRAVADLIDREWPATSSRQQLGPLFRKMPLRRTANDGDNSCSQFAILGLWMAARNEMPAPSETWLSALAMTRNRQADDGGWHYQQPYRDRPSYGSMTCAGICTSALCLHHLGRDPLLDGSVQRGLLWLTKNWALDRNPHAGGSHYYYLYSIERVGRILGVDFVGNQEWYPQGARYLIDHQRPDGAWKETPPSPVPPAPEASRAGTKYSDLAATSFALLFLTKATEPLVREKDGMLATVLPVSPPPRIYIILDASGSMLNVVGQKAKFEAAREAVGELVKLLPDDIELALRVYGHNTAPGSPKAAEDTVLEIPLRKLDRAAFASKLAALQARGDTPLALSLLQAKADLEAADISPEKPLVVVLLTDGKEDTKAKRDPVAAAREFSKIKGVTTHVVGFDIHSAEASNQLASLATTAGGSYWPVDRAEELARQLQQAVGAAPPAEFAVIDKNGNPAGKGTLGDTVSLRPGQYTLVVSGRGGQEHREEITIRPGQTTTCGGRK